MLAFFILSFSIPQGLSFSAFADSHHATSHPKIIHPTPPCTLVKGEINLPISDHGWGIYFAPQDKSADYDFVISCKGCPQGSDRYQPQIELSFSADKSGPNPPISLSQTSVTSAKFTAKTRSQVPAEYTALIIATLNANGIPIDDKKTSFSFEAFQHSSSNRKIDVVTPSEICFVAQSAKGQ